MLRGGTRSLVPPLLKRYIPALCMMKASNAGVIISMEKRTSRPLIVPAKWTPHTTIPALSMMTASNAGVIMRMDKQMSQT